MPLRLPFSCTAALFAAGLMLNGQARANPTHARAGSTWSNAQGSSLQRPDWIWSSVPLDPSGQPRTPTLSEHARTQWYNARGVRERDLDPSWTAEEGGDREHGVLELSIGDTTTTLTPSVWTGLTRARSRSGEALWRTQAVEIWINDKTPIHGETHATFHIDFGRVSEDAFWERDKVPNGVLDTEDRKGGVADTKLDDGEDTGLDGLMDKDEPGYDPVTNPDPNGDDYHYDQNNPNDYSKINGLEGTPPGSRTPGPTPRIWI